MVKQKAKIITNPNGANQYLLDPRQKLCWDLYINPKSETFGNATQSALKVGYKKVSAERITTCDWFIAKCSRLQMLDTAEKVLKKTLEYPTEDEEGKVQVDLLRVQTDVAKHITKTLGKDEGYSDRTEHTGKDGEPLIPEQDIQDKIDDSINKYLNGNINGNKTNPKTGNA